MGAVLENAQTPTPVPEVEPSQKEYETKERHDGRSLNYAKLYLWIGAVVLVVIQGFLIGWWTLLAGPATGLVLYGIYYLLDIIIDHFYE